MKRFVLLLPLLAVLLPPVASHADERILDYQSDVMIQDAASVLSAILLNGLKTLPSSGSVFDASAFTAITVGDYNADSFSDVLLENGSGLLFELLLQGTSILPASTSVWTAPTGWTIVGG